MLHQTRTQSPGHPDANRRGGRPGDDSSAPRQPRGRTLGQGWRRAALMSALAVGAVAAPLALAAGGSPRAQPASSQATATAAASANPIRGAIHNPPNSAYSRTTGIFARSEGWTGRLENLGSGGAATLGCHALAGGPPCLGASNQASGLAFSFSSGGSLGGEILVHNTTGAPFTTNAHGVAAGLNANYLEGKQANEFQLVNQPAANAEALGGRKAGEYAITGQLLFADVAVGPVVSVIEGHRGATAVTQAPDGSGTAYTVTFGTANLVNCSFTASPQGGVLTGGQLGVEGGGASSPSTVVVRAPAGFTGGFDLQVIC